MNENAVFILDQYDLAVQRTYAGRGVIMLETQEGIKTVREFTGSRAILPYEQQLMRHLLDSSVCLTDRIIPTREGELLARDSDGIYYLVKEYPEGKALDTKNREDLCRAMALMAMFHRTARGIWELPSDGSRLRILGSSVHEEYEKHNRELRKVQKFIRGRQKKGEFELLFLKCVPKFLEQGQEAERLLLETGYDSLFAEACRKGYICHGEYVHHNVWFGRHGEALVNFDKCCVDVQVHDLYLFLRKILEKHNWNKELGRKMLDAYEKVRPLSLEERTHLALRLYYPEKIWKLANHYFHTNKAWIPEKSCEKLSLFLEQEEARTNFIKDVLEFPKKA